MDHPQRRRRATDGNPSVTLTTPADPNRTSAFLNVRVADIQKVYREWSAKGAEFLTEPKNMGAETRAYVRDPDGHLIEVGQLTRGYRKILGRLRSTAPTLKSRGGSRFALGRSERR